MPEQKHCIRCDRAIDAHARICPFCNWDQTDPNVAAAPEAQPTDYVPPSEMNWRRYALMSIGAVVLLVGSFALGSLVHGKTAPKNVKSPIEDSTTTAAPPSRRVVSDVTLVPVNDTTGIEPPITSAPAVNQAQGIPPEYQRSDATAVSSAEYAQLAARANAERQQQRAAVDPRSLTGPAYAQAEQRPPAPARDGSATPPTGAMTSAAPPAAQPPASSHVVIRTRPVPESQPVPDITVEKTTTVRLDLVIGADGRVKEVNINGGIPGQTPKLIAAVQQWRFKPATENGVPVEAAFSTELSFRGQ